MDSEISFKLPLKNFLTRGENISLSTQTSTSGTGPHIATVCKILAQIYHQVILVRNYNYNFETIIKAVSRAPMAWSENTLLQPTILLYSV